MHQSRSENSFLPISPGSQQVRITVFGLLRSSGGGGHQCIRISSIFSQIHDIESPGLILESGHSLIGKFCLPLFSSFGRDQYHTICPLCTRSEEHTSELQSFHRYNKIGI